MTAPDPDAVQVLAAAYHAEECLPAASPNTRWSEAHHNRDRRKADRMAERIRNAGWHLTTTKES